MKDHKLEVFSLGKIRVSESSWNIEFKTDYKDALTGLEGFSHVQVLFWLHMHDTPEMRKTIVCNKPYKKAPDVLGIFATRSDYRPNPIGLSICMIKKLDKERGCLELYYIDAEDNTPLIDIKPYHPAVDRVKQVKTPAWCSHWPQWYEDAGNFDWASEFNFPID